MSVQHRSLLAARRVARRAGVDLVRRNFYSPIPADLPDSTWDRRSPLRGIDFDIDEQMRWVRAHVAPHAQEFQPPVQLPGGRIFEYANGSFGHGDADVLYGVIRTRKPSRIVELGSGNSSVVIRLALQQNTNEGHACDYRAFDPYPNDVLAGTSMALPIQPTPAERLDEAVVTALMPGDILFVDTTHTVKTGGDVVRIVLELLPAVMPGVLIHIHDVPMPFEYGRELSANGFYWAEMYLVQAFLAYNERFAVRASLRALAVDHRSEFAKVVPSITDGAPISLWIERTVP